MEPLRLLVGKRSGNVHVRLEQISKAMCMTLPDAEIDLLHMAAYVYAADQASSRGGHREFEYGEKWRRHFRFEIAVRRPRLWQRREVNRILTETLSYLSGDDYEFAFHQYRNPPPIQKTLFLKPSAHEDHGFQEVVLFSGGLDSLGGAIQEIIQGQRKVALVSHYSTPKIYARQRRLVEELNGRLPHTSLKPLHVAIEINKKKQLTRDHMQRGRSFLFMSIAAIVARLFRLNRIRFYENGVVSLNLPISPQVLDSRATRTTHPQVLDGFERLLCLIFDRGFQVQNPFLWKTRTKILTEIKASKHSDLCALTSSCSRTMAMTTAHPHCGRCSQCIDRRLAALAAGLDESDDPSDGYASDVLLGEREEEDRTMIERYVGVLLQVRGIQDPVRFTELFPEAARVFAYTGLTATEAALAVFELYRDHANEVCEALAQVVRRESERLVTRSYPDNCLLQIWIDGRRSLPPGAATDEWAGKPRLVMDPELFTAAYRGKSCPLGNTLEFRFLVRLNEHPAHYVTYLALSEDVWGRQNVNSNAIHRVAGSVRRQLAAHEVLGVEIDGRQTGNYRVVLS